MKKLKQERGSITLFVVVSMLFFVLFLAGTYMLSNSKEQAQTSQTARIKEIYEKDMNNIDDVYATLIEENFTTKLKPGEISNYTIKNNYTDGYKNATIPEGFTVSGLKDEQIIENGLVIYDIPKGIQIDWSLDTNSDEIPDVQERYNQFVWIPVEGMDYLYERVDFGKQYGSYIYKELIPEDEKKSIETYGGYYIARYEAGISNDKEERSGMNESQTSQQIEKISGKALSQKSKNTYTYLTRDQAKGLAETMYKEEKNSITSKLCSSYAWDTSLKFIEIKNSTYPNNSVGGNYTIDSGGTGKLQKTGYHSVSNIYDMGGNQWEWTTETSDGNPYVLRGGYYANSSKDIGASYRFNDLGGKTYPNYMTFRVTLFIKN